SEPKIIDAALRACRRLNDFASTVRILEAEIYPYVIQELRPTLNELGISTPEELGLDKVYKPHGWASQGFIDIAT
uniref:Cytochrome c oxidase subunit 5A, mitochondrial n=1 Tax=Aotus nancymaae TaxID=37293 RepID=A0A2K5EJP0_AOTNA